ncbi:MAG: sel1 repeat family protein [Prevotella sp.]|nr:sel1 repeat family protein [Candidatus Equicola faecalis]
MVARIVLFFICLICANDIHAQYGYPYPYTGNPYYDAYQTGRQLGKAIGDAITSIVEDDIYDRSSIKKNINKWGECKNGTLSIKHGAIAIYKSNGYAYSNGVDKRLSSKIKEINNAHKSIDDVNITDNGYFIVVYDGGTDWYGVIPSSLSTALKKYPNGTVFRSISFNDETGVYAITTSESFESNNKMYNDCFNENIGTKGQLLSANINDNGCVFCFSKGVEYCGYIPNNLKPAVKDWGYIPQFVKFNRHGDYLICGQNGGYSYYITDTNSCGDTQLTFHNVIVNIYKNETASNGGAKQNTNANTPSNNGSMAGKQTTNNSAKGMFEKALQYYNAKNYTEAAKWFRKAAEQGDADAQYNLGACYYNGYGVTKSYAEAAKWYRKAAEQGDADAQCMLGICYYGGDGVAKNYTEAVKWYRKAAEQGLAQAQYNLGNSYNNGKGVTKSDTEAVKWYRKAAEQGLAEAQYCLGNFYYNDEGVTKDYAEAVKWYRKAAEQGYPSAQGWMAVCYYYGEGVEKNNELSKMWATKLKNNPKSTNVHKTAAESFLK